MLLAAVWTIIISRTFAGDTLKWLGVADGVLLLVLAVLALVLDEAALEMQLQLTERSRKTANPRPAHAGADGHSARERLRVGAL